MAAILDFRLAFASDDILLSAIELGILQNMLWNFDSLLSTSWDTCISGLAITNLDLSFPPVTSDSIDCIDDVSCESSDLENIRLPLEFRRHKVWKQNYQR